MRVFYPKAGRGALFDGLVRQLAQLGVPVVPSVPASSELARDFDVLVDALFGFSFAAGAIRAPFDEAIARLNGARSVPLFSVDVPSGWPVDDERAAFAAASDPSAKLHTPDALISLTAPKMCATHFGGAHYIGGRFVPPALAAEFDFGVPPYAGADPFPRVSSPPACPAPAPAL